MTIKAELQSLTPSAFVDLFVLELTRHGGPTLFFHAGTNQFEEDVVFGGQVYSRLAMEATGFTKTSEGASPRPVVRVSNQGGAMAALARQYKNFLRCRFIRKRTFVRFLDAENFINGNPEADPTQTLIEEIWYVDRKAKENPEMMEFELASPFDMQGVMIPAREMLQTCNSLYRSSECSYAGPPVADINDNPTSDPNKDACSHLVRGCKLRFPTGDLPFGGFPGTGRIR